MNEIAKSQETYLEHLCLQAKDLGASEAVAIPVTDVVLDERTFLKCLVPLCSHYGVDLTCPPNVPPVSKFREIIKCYQSAILVKVDVPASDPPGGGGNGGKQPESPTAEYRSVIRDARKRLHEIVCQVESLCFEEGYHFAAGLVGGSCPLCDECIGVKSGLPCRYPFKARPAMEAMGVDVVATAKKAGLNIGFGKNDSRSWVGLVLVS